MSWRTFNHFLTGATIDKKIELKTLFSETFKNHKKSKTELLDSQTNHPKPWKWLRVMLFLLILGIVSFLNTLLIGELAFPWLALMVASIIPITCAVFLNETVLLEKFRFLDISIVFLIGTTISFLATGILLVDLGDTGLNAVLVAPVIEEIAKFLVILFAIKLMKIKRVSSAIFIGWVIGAGFQIAETLGYSTFFGYYGIFSQIQLLPGGTNYIFTGTLDFSTMFTRFFFSFGSHAFYGAIHGAASIFASRGSTRKHKIGRQVVWFAFCVLMHMIWNIVSVYITIPVLGTILSIFIQLLYFPLFFYLIDAGMRDHNEYMASMIVKETAAEEIAHEEVADTAAE
jgi:RsiW-degrading membrane proteinase PrsW (M82 family)